MPEFGPNSIVTNLSEFDADANAEFLDALREHLANYSGIARAWILSIEFLDSEKGTPCKSFLLFADGHEGRDKLAHDMKVASASFPQPLSMYGYDGMKLHIDPVPDNPFGQALREKQKPFYTA